MQTIQKGGLLLNLSNIRYLCLAEQIRIIIPFCDGQTDSFHRYNLIRRG